MRSLDSEQPLPQQQRGQLRPATANLSSTAGETRPQMRTVLVTGGSGFIGSHLVEGLLRQGHRVRCLVRSLERPGWLKDLPVELLVGNCNDSELLHRAVTPDIEWVFHVAGASWHTRRSEYFRTNRDGTNELIKACIDNCPNLDRFIYFSSQSAAGPARNGKPVTTEDDPQPISCYGESKLAAERLLNSNSASLHSVILRPSSVYGPRDRTFLPYLKLARRGILFDYGRGPRSLSLCHVGDLVGAALAAARADIPSGSCYFVAHPRNYDWIELEDAVRTTVSPGARTLRVPKWCVSLAAGAGQLYGQLTGAQVKFNRARGAELLERCWECEGSRIWSELGYSPRWELIDGIRKTVAWYEEHGWLK